jgi:hypothetical protein
MPENEEAEMKACVHITHWQEYGENFSECELDLGGENTRCDCTHCNALKRAFIRLRYSVCRWFE